MPTCTAESPKKFSKRFQFESRRQCLGPLGEWRHDALPVGKGEVVLHDKAVVEAGVGVGPLLRGEPARTLNLAYIFPELGTRQFFSSVT